MSREKRKKSVILGYLLILIGISLPMYAMINMSLRNLKQEDQYQEYVQDVVPETVEEKPEIEAYEENLGEFEPVDPFTEEGYQAQYDFYRAHPDKIFAYLTIPKLEMKKPVYLDANYDHLDKGVAHVDGTSLPIGGLSRRSVIAGHRGWYRDTMFLNLHLLEPGDQVILEQGGKTLYYEVQGHEVIGPNDWDALSPWEGEDVLTLLTCDPIAPPRPKRLLVNCLRTEEPITDVVESATEPTQSHKEIQPPDPKVKLVSYGIYAITIALIVLFIFTFSKFFIYLFGA